MPGDTVRSEVGRSFDRENGSFIKRVSDDELLAAWQEEPSTRKLARRFGYDERSMRKRLADLRVRGLLTNAAPDVDREGKIAQLAASVPAEMAGGKLKELGITLYGVAGMHKDREHFISEGLDSTRATYRFDGKPALDVIPHESKIVAYRPTGIKKPRLRRIFLVGDQQIGFWAVRDPNDPKKISFDPFHDESAIDVMLQAMSHYRPDQVVIVGDFIDFPQLSKFQQEPEFEGTLQATIQEAHDLIGKIRASVGPKCQIDFIPGNHETRMQRAIVNNNPGLYNLTKPGEKYAIYSVPFLLDFEKRNVSMAAEYPSGEVWIAKRNGQIPGLVVTHADPKRKDMRADSIHGHLVLPGIETRQVFEQDGPVTFTRICVSGCGNYSDTGDKVRLTRTNTPSGRARMGAVQSFATVDIDKRTGMRSYGLHLIHNGKVHFDGAIIESKLARAA
jgi:hypothetical protein